MSDRFHSPPNLTPVDGAGQMDSMTTERIPGSVVVDLVSEAISNGWVTPAEGRRGLRRHAEDQPLRLRLRTGWYVHVVPESIKCDCGKGILCPLNIQTPVST